MLALLVTAPLDAAWAEPVVVVHREVPVAGLNRNAVRALFAMRGRSWEDGTPVEVFVLPDDEPLHAEFSKRVLHVFPHQLRREWDRRLYSGTGRAPHVVRSAAEMYQGVVSTPGAIGYLPPIMVDDALAAVALEE